MEAFTTILFQNNGKDGLKGTEIFSNKAMLSAILPDM